MLDTSNIRLPGRLVVFPVSATFSLPLLNKLLVLLKFPSVVRSLFLRQACDEGLFLFVNIVSVVKQLLLGHVVLNKMSVHSLGLIGAHVFAADRLRWDR